MSQFTEDASEAIHHTGGRMTAQRRRIIEMLEQSSQKLDADAIYAQVSQHDAGISLATVYRTLHALETAGLIKPRYHSPDHAHKFYEPVYAESEHHFTCRVCHRVIPFKTRLIDELKQTLADELGVDVVSGCICVNGLCPECAAKAEQCLS